jgi:hypothetical protein
MMTMVNLALLIRDHLKPYLEETISAAESMSVGADETVQSIKQFLKETIARSRASMQEQNSAPGATAQRIAGIVTEKY